MTTTRKLKSTKAPWALLTALRDLARLSGEFEQIRERLQQTARRLPDADLAGAARRGLVSAYMTREMQIAAEIDEGAEDTYAAMERMLNNVNVIAHYSGIAIEDVWAPLIEDANGRG